MTIQLFCNKSFTGSALKSKLENALKERHLSYQVTESNDAAEFIKAGISSIPAIKIGEHVVVHEEHDPIDETIHKVMQIVTAENQAFILVPVDFSQSSNHALRYAQIVAAKLGMGITVAHIHQPVFDPVTGSSFDVEMMKENQQRLEELLVELGWEQFKSGKRVSANTYFDVGEVSSRLIELVEDKKYPLIIMSTQAEDTFTKRMLGSVSTHVSRVSPKPVIVVPPDASLQFPSRMVVGLTEEFVQENALNYLVDFTVANDIFMEFVYIMNDVQDFNTIKDSLYTRLKSINKSSLQYHVSSVPYLAGKVEEPLMAFAVQKHADLLVVLAQHRTLIDSLGHRSVSKKVLLHPALPVMVLPGHEVNGVGITEFLYEVIREG